MWRKRISLKAKRTDPYSCAYINISGSISKVARNHSQEYHTRKDSAQPCTAACKRQVHTVARAYLVSPLRGCTVLQWGPRAWKLPRQYQHLPEHPSMTLFTIRVLGKTFQLSRTPSRSSTSFHWSLSASKSMIRLRQGPRNGGAIVNTPPLFAVAVLHASMQRIRAVLVGRGVVSCMLTWWLFGHRKNLGPNVPS